MPYGVDKKLGGDNEENDSWMERCVSGISGKNKRTGQPYTKGEKIAICKAQLKRKKEKAEFQPDEVIEIDADIVNNLESFKEEWMRKVINQGKTFNDALYLFDAFLAFNKYKF